MCVFQLAEHGGLFDAFGKPFDLKSCLVFLLCPEALDSMVELSAQIMYLLALCPGSYRGGESLLLHKNLGMRLCIHVAQLCVSIQVCGPYELPYGERQADVLSGSTCRLMLFRSC